MKLFIDHRESSVLDKLCNICDQYTIEYEITQLPLGDFLLLKNGTSILIERKSTPDFVSSIRSNRLWDQLLRFMKVSTLFDHTITRKLLIVHGSFDGEPAPVWPQIMGAFMEILFVYDIPLIVAEDDDSFYHCMRILIQRETKGQNDLLPQSRWFRKHLSPDLPEMDVKRYVLASLPSVGEALAKKLLDHFGSIKAVASATENQLQTVEGIGTKKAKKIYRIFH
jgi:ERCC4-type nuclease